MAVIPVAKALYLCEEIDDESGALNLYALFNAISADAFPHTLDSFCVFVQLAGGLGHVRVHCDISRASDERVIRVSNVYPLRFDRRSQLLRLAITLEGTTFDEPGVYVVQLFCDNTWVADVTLELRENV